MTRLLAFSLALLGLAAAGCKQGEGDRCQITSDCSDGLICSMAGKCVDPMSSDIDAAPRPDVSLTDADLTPDADVPDASPPDAMAPDANPPDASM